MGLLCFILAVLVSALKSRRSLAITTALSDKISRYTLDGCDWQGLLELMGRPVEMISCYYDGFWLHSGA
jgi:hypothetical protein